jgi:DinB superfamily
LAQGTTTEDLRYPIGTFQYAGGSPDQRQREQWIEAIASAPRSLRNAVAGLSEDQLETTYRPGGWTVRQVVHHVPDSHLNAYLRMKLALTEDKPTIKPYEEARWAELPDGRTGPIQVSLTLLEALHHRWVLLLRQLTPTQFERRFVHPEHGRQIEIQEALALYAWHGQHHAAHIQSLRRRMDWS